MHIDAWRSWIYGKLRGMPSEFVRLQLSSQRIDRGIM
jgi:hypothetical protein